MSIHSEAKLDRKFVDLARQLNLYLNHFPKHEKYGLSLQIRNAAYDVYGYVVEAQKRYHKKTTLTNLDVRHEQLRMLVRLAFELGYFEFSNGAVSEEPPDKLAVKRYTAISAMVDEMGRMIGGWLNAELDRDAKRPKDKE
jgi:hypothetical protein